MEKQKKIIDASVVVKWFLNEKNSDVARILRKELENKEFTLIVPDLLFLEVLNTLRYKAVKKDYILKANEILLGLGLEVIRINYETMLKTIENSVKYNITIYDALYITIAQLHGVFMITADEELYKIPNVISLEKI